MEVWYISINHVLTFLAIFLRVSILLFVLPFYRGTELPTSFKALLALFIALIFYIPLSSKIPPVNTNPIELASVVIGEMILGLIFAMTVLFFLGAFETAGDIISFQMGFGFARVADPVTGVQITLISRFFQIFASLLFFALNGHHFFIRALYTSFVKIPPGSFFESMEHLQLDRIISLSGLIFTLAFKIAAPIIIVLFISEIGMGLIVKFAPQINILVVSFALTIIVGILFAALSIGEWAQAIQDSFKELFLFIFKVLI